MTKRLIVIGAGGHAADVIEAVESCGEFSIEGLVYDGGIKGETRYGFPVLGDLNSFLKHTCETIEVVVAIGSPRGRRSVVSRLNQSGASIKYPAIVHSKAVVAESSVILEGTVICAGAIISRNVRLSEFNVVNIGATIGHGIQCAAYVTIAPGVNVSGDVVLGPGVELGAGAVVREKLTLDAGSMAAMGAVVMKDVKKNSMVLGNPARPLNQLEEW